MGLEKDLLQIIADGTGGTYSASTGSQNVTNVADAVTSTLEQTNLSAVTATGAGPAINSSKFNKIGVQYTASSVSTGGTVLLQGSNDNSNWATLDTEAISANGTTHYQGDIKFKYVRANLSARTDGTYTVIILLGN